MNRVRESLSLLNWIFFRLPLAFSLSFTALTLWWVFYGFRWAWDLVGRPLLRLVTLGLEGVLPAFVAKPLADNLATFLLAAVIILVFLLGLLIAYNFSALLNWILLKSGWNPYVIPPGHRTFLTPRCPRT